MTAGELLRAAREAKLCAARPAAGREEQRGLRMGLVRLAREAQLCAARDGCVRLLAEKHSALSEWDCVLQFSSRQRALRV
jgi:hypothetical protein